MAERETVLILDFGGQYTRLIARRVRENHVYSEVVPADISARDICGRAPAGLILSGGPASVHDADAPTCWAALWNGQNSGNTAAFRCG